MGAGSSILSVSIIDLWKNQEVFLLYARMILGNCWHHLGDKDQIRAIG
jgi:hypothetical protein